MYSPDKTMLMENSRVHVYVMTNPDNDARTRKLFRKYRKILYKLFSQFRIMES